MNAVNYDYGYGYGYREENKSALKKVKTLAHI